MKLTETLSKTISQAEFAELVGVSEARVSQLVADGIIARGETAAQWLRSYCANLREQAAGRAGGGELDLVEERAKLAQAQRVRIEMQNAVTRRQLAPVSIIEEVLATVGRQIVGILEAVPVQLKRNSNLAAADIEFVTRELIKARNLAAAIKLDERSLAMEEGEVEFEGLDDGSV